MSLLTRITNAVAKQSTKTPVPFVSRHRSLGGFAGAQPSAGQLSRMGAVPTLFAVVSRICETTAGVEWHLYRKPEAGKQVGDSQRDIVEPNRHAAAALLAKPNAFMSRSDLDEVCQQFEELLGESFAIITRTGGIPTELWPVRPDRMIEVPDPVKYLAGWDYRAPDGELIRLKVEDVLHIKSTPNPESPYRGLSRIAALIRDLDGATAAAEWNANFFRNSAQPGGLIEVDRRLSDEEFDELRGRWDEQHRGVSNAHRVAILEAGKWTNRSFSMRDMEFSTLRNVSRDVIMEAYGVSRATLGVTDGVNFAAAKAAKAQFGELVVVPRLNRRRQAWNHKLLPQFGPTAEGVEVDYEDPVGLDPEAENAERNSKVTAVVDLVQAGWNPSSAAKAYGLPEMQYGIGKYDPDRDLLVKTLITSGGTLAAMILPMLGFDLPADQGPAVENAERNSKADAVAKLIDAGFNPTSAAAAYELPEMQYGLSGYDPDRDLLVKTLISSGGTLGELILPMLGFDLPTPAEQGKEEPAAPGESGDPTDMPDEADGAAPPPADEDGSNGHSEPASEEPTDEGAAAPSVPRETSARAVSSGPTCQYCGADCSEGRSWDGGDLYACGPCSDARAERNRKGGEP